MSKAFVNGIHIDYQIHGEGDPLILLTGLGGDQNSWFFQINAFKKYFKVVVFDNRGIGNSDRPEEPYTIKTMADDAVALMDHLNIDKSNILGISMGGMIAQEIAINYPDRLKKLILGSTYLGGQEMGEITKKMRIALGLESNFSKWDAKNVDIEKFMGEVASLSFNIERYKKIFIPLSEQYLKRTGLEGFSGQIAAASDCNTLDRLHLIKSQTLVITGTEDRVVPCLSSEIIADKIPDSKLTKIEGGSHAMYLEMSDRFNSEVLDFLKNGRSV